jgi:hypothetical protein
MGDGHNMISVAFEQIGDGIEDGNVVVDHNDALVRHDSILEHIRIGTECSDPAYQVALSRT